MLVNFQWKVFRSPVLLCVPGSWDCVVALPGAAILHSGRACSVPQSCLFEGEAVFLCQPQFLMLLCFRSGNMRFTQAVNRQVWVGQDMNSGFQPVQNMGFVSLLRDLEGVHQW